MKRQHVLYVSVILCSVIFLTSFALAQYPEDPDKTLSPYFFVMSDDTSLDRLPLKSTSAEINIAGVIADITVTQVYKNEGPGPIEAIYVFPASTRAAVYGMKMTIGQRQICAEIHERQEARMQYEQAIKEGRAEGVKNVTNALYDKAVSGDSVAMIFFLKNRDNEHWRDKSEVKNEVNVGEEFLKAIAPTLGPPSLRKKTRSKKK